MKIVLYDDEGVQVREIDVPEVLAGHMMNEVSNILMNARY